MIYFYFIPRKTSCPADSVVFVGQSEVVCLRYNRFLFHRVADRVIHFQIPAGKLFSLFAIMVSIFIFILVSATIGHRDPSGAGYIWGEGLY